MISIVFFRFVGRYNFDKCWRWNTAVTANGKALFSQENLTVNLIWANVEQNLSWNFPDSQ